MSQLSVGAAPQYYLPSSMDAVPAAWQSNKSAKPVGCSLQTTNVPAISGAAGASATTNIQLPLGASSGLMLNPYLRFDLSVTKTADAATLKFKGPNACASSLINTYTTFVNSVQCDQIANYDQVAEQIYSHGTSRDWISQDASILMGAGRTLLSANTDTAASLGTFVLPLLGMLGSQQAFPAYLCNGTLQVSIQWNDIARAFQVTGVGASITAFSCSNIQLVYDKISPEQSFVDAVKASMMMAGNKYVLSYLNLENSAFGVADANASIQYGLNVSSLRGLVASQLVNTELAVAQAGLSSSNTLTGFAVSLDGRLINNTIFQAGTVAAPLANAAVFAELQKVYSRIFDASVTDAASTANFATNYFAVGVSACRVNEALAFSGSAATVCNIAYTRSAGSAATLFLTFLTDRQILIDASGQISLVR